MSNNLKKSDEIDRLKNDRIVAEKFPFMTGILEGFPMAKHCIFRQQFHNLKMAKNQSMTEHIAQLLKLADRLSAIGVNVDDMYRISVLFNSLPIEYDDVVTSLMTEQQLTMPIVAAALLKEEKLLSKQKEEPEENEFGAHSTCGQCVYRHFDRKWGRDKWLIDTMASTHMTNDRSKFWDFKEFDEPKKVKMISYDGNDKFFKALGIGMVKHQVKNKETPMFNVLLVPDLDINLFSVSETCKRGNNVQFGPYGCVITSGTTGEILPTNTLQYDGRSFLQCTAMKR